MSPESQNLEGPDLTAGIPMDSLADGVPLRGHVDGEAVIVVRRGDDVYAIGATCSHYGGPLADGLVVDDTVRCPWHHACFSLRTGEALRAEFEARHRQLYGYATGESVECVNLSVVARVPDVAVALSRFEPSGTTGVIGE